MYTWPKGYRHVMSQSEHGNWNTEHFPGTRQTCFVCHEPTGRWDKEADPETGEQVVSPRLKRRRLAERHLFEKEGFQP